jgi:trimethylamine---corrinoid protein Co-methyltransferase
MSALQQPGQRYRPLTEDEVQQIRSLSSRVLWELGIKIEHEQALERFSELGADVDFSGQLVKIHPYLQEQLLSTVPRKLHLYGLGGSFIELNCRNVYLGTGGNVLNILDLETGRRRPSLLADLCRIAYLTQKLESVDFFVIPLYPNDIDLADVDTNCYYHSLINTDKHVMSGIHHPSSMDRVIDMAAQMVGGEDKLREKPVISFIASITSPRKITGEAVALIKKAAERSVPVAIAPAPISGITAPVTLMGTLIQQNAETLAGLMLSQAFAEGAPALYGAVNCSADFRTMSFLFGSVEMAMMNAGAVQVAHSYGLPLYASAGVTESKLPDGQAGIEKSYSVLMTALAGGDYIHLAAGMLESGLTVAYEQYVMDNEILAMAKRAVAGIRTSNEYQAFDAIRETAPGGNYMAAPLTLKYMRSEHFFPGVFDREPFDKWQQKGGKDIRTRCQEKARQLLSGYRPVEVRDDIKKVFPEISNQ